MSEAVYVCLTTGLGQWCGDGCCRTCFSRWALEVREPADVIDQSTLYMRIYFLGMPFFMLYNYGAAILRAVGDTRRPLMFLVVASADQRGAEYDSGDRVSSGCCRCLPLRPLFPQLISCIFWFLDVCI